MAPPIIVSTTAFPFSGIQVSPNSNTATNPTWRFFSMRVDNSAAAQAVNNVGFFHADVFTNLGVPISFYSTPVVWDVPVGVYLPDELVGCIWRVKFVPTQKTPLGSGAFVQYRI